MIPFVEDDGGRAEAGFRGEAGDCVTRAIAIATGIPYREVYDALAEGQANRRDKRANGKRAARNGVHRSVYDRYLQGLGWVWTPTMHIGSGTTVHLRADELPPGRLVVRVTKHMCAVIDGVLHDTHDCSRQGTRAVYGYWSAP